MSDQENLLTSLRRAGGGERKRLLADFFMQHRPQLRAMVELRLDPRLRKRFDPSDVVQEAYLEAQGRLAEYLRRPPMPLLLWLRRIAVQKLFDLHEHHLRAKVRAVAREISLDAGPGPAASSAVLARSLFDQGPPPERGLEEEERRQVVLEALDRLDPSDREILALRCFERLSPAETAAVLRIEKEAARKRYSRALKRLKVLLESRSSELEGSGE